MFYKPCFRTVPKYSPTCCKASIRNAVTSTYFAMEKTSNHLENTSTQRHNKTKQNETRIEFWGKL